MGYQAVLDALSDPMRQRILERLRRGPMSVGQIAADLPVSRPAVSRHLRVLKGCRLVASEPAGTRNLYRIEPRGLEEVREWIDRFWDEPLERYSRHVRQTEPSKAGRKR